VDTFLFCAVQIWTSNTHRLPHYCWKSFITCQLAGILQQNICRHFLFILHNHRVLGLCY